MFEKEKDCWEFIKETKIKWSLTDDSFLTGYIVIAFSLTWALIVFGIV